jgi:hypothetical protein
VADDEDFAGEGCVRGGYGFVLRRCEQDVMAMGGGSV